MAPHRPAIRGFRRKQPSAKVVGWGMDVADVASRIPLRNGTSTMDEDTEAVALRFKGLDTWEVPELLEALWSGQSRSVAACLAALPALAIAVEAATRRLSATDGRLVYAGAGASGRRNHPATPAATMASTATAAATHTPIDRFFSPTPTTAVALLGSARAFAISRRTSAIS